MLKKLFSKQNRALLSELVRTDFKLRYQGSVLGYAWSLLRPLLLFLILYIVFVKFLKLGSGIPHYPIYLLFGIVLWNFFAEITSQSLGSIVVRGDLIRKIRIPRWIIVLSSSISAIINLCLNMIVIFVFMMVNHVILTDKIIYLPFILAEIYLFALAVSLFLAAGFVKFRDLSYVWEVVMQGAFYLTPIIYPLSIISNHNFQKILLLNPVAQAIQDARYFVVTKNTVTIASAFGESYIRLVLFGAILVFLILGILYFKSQAEDFAENI